MAGTPEISSGVQELIDKLRTQGIVEGQKQAEQLINEAHSKASQILLEAQRKADKLLSEAHQKIEVEKRSSQEAIKTAFRDTGISLRTKLWDAFSAHLKRLVSLELKDKDFIKQLILAIAASKASELKSIPHIEILLPAKIAEGNEKKSPTNQKDKTKLHHLVLGLTNEMLREGIELIPSADVKGGIKVKLSGKDLEIDLTDETLSNLLLKYLLPRYREIISGRD